MSLFVRCDDGTMVNVEQATTLRVHSGNGSFQVVADLVDDACVLRDFGTGDGSLEAAEQFLQQIAARANGGGTSPIDVPTLTATIRPGPRFGAPQVRR